MTSFETEGPEGSRRRTLITGVILIFGALLLAWQIVAATFADSLAALEPDGALRWQADHGEALRRKAEILLIEGGGVSPGAEALIAGALGKTPLSPEAVRTAGLIEDGKGNRERAAALMEIAASRSLYEIPARLWLVRYYAEREDAPRVVEHLNALLAMAPSLPAEIRTRLMDGLLALSVSGETSALIITELETRPGWRGAFLRRLAEGAPEAGLAIGLFTRLQQSAAPPSQEELAPLLERLVRERDYDNAYLVWVGSLDLADGREIANVYNGGFEYALSPVPFDWSLRRGNGAEITISPRGDAGDALHIRFRGGRTEFRGVTQTLFLNPGAYELSGEIRVESQAAPPELEWVVLCPENTIVGRTQSFSRTRGWTTFSALFSIPEGCSGQQLRLQHNADADLSAAGEVWFDNIQAVRVGASH